MDWAKLGEIGVTAFAAFGSAYWGAQKAFDFNRLHETERTRTQQIEECNRAMLTLARQFNWLLNYKAQMLDPIREDPARHLSLAPSDDLEFRTWTVNVPAITFLVGTLAGEIPFMMALLDQKFHSVTSLLNARSPVHREFQLRLEASTIDPSRETTLAEIHAAVGPRLVHTLTNATNQVYDLTDDAVAKFTAAGTDLKRALQAMYPDAFIVGFKLP